MSSIIRYWLLVSRRLDRRRAGAAALILLIGALVAQTLVAARSTTASLGRTAPIVVAGVDLAPGQAIAASDLRVQQHPIGLHPPNVVASPSQVIGATVRSATSAGEPLSLQRIGPGRLGLGSQELAVTLPTPLARPPVEIGDGVELVGIGLIPETELVEARVLGPARVVHHDDDGITVAVPATLSVTVVEWLAAGAVDIVLAPDDALTPHDTHAPRGVLPPHDTE